MKLNTFDGGLSTRLDETLIEANEAPMYTNIDSAKGNLTSIKDYLLTETSIDRWFYKFANVWYSSINDREYIEYKDKLYWTEKENKPSKVVGGVIKRLGIDGPTVKLIAVEGTTGVLPVSTVQYVYTYYDSAEGIESAPSPLSDELTIVINKQVDLSGFLPSDNVSVDKIRLYRVGVDATEFTLVVELPVSTTTYSDNIPALSTVGDILDSSTNQAPLTGLRYIIEAYGILFAAIGSTLYYTRIGLPDAWPALNTIPISGDITGIVAIPDGIVIYTLSKSYLLLGTESTTFRIILLNPEHGCTSHNSIKVCRNTLLWTSADGICALSGNSITVTTKDKLNRITLDVISATVYNEQYMLTLTDGTVFINDLRFGKSIFKIIDFIGADVYNLGVFNNILYGVIKEKIALMDAGRQIDFYYTSPRITEGDAAVTKLYNNVYINLQGTFIFDVLIDGTKVCRETIEGSGVYEIKVPQEKQRGSDIQFKVQGTGIVREIEYKVLGRENGR